jgi:hypothetical protein
VRIRVTEVGSEGPGGATEDGARGRASMPLPREGPERCHYGIELRRQRGRHTGEWSRLEATAASQLPSGGSRGAGQPRRSDRRLARGGEKAAVRGRE